MFGYNEKVTLTGNNIINKDGKFVDSVIKFPIDEESLNIPDDVIQMSIYEGYDGKVTYIGESFKIYVGGITSLREICDSNKENVSMLDHDVFKKIKSVDDKVCYYETDGYWHVFAHVNDGDIVVKNIDELKNVLVFISNRFNNIQKSIVDVKELKLINK